MYVCIYKSESLDREYRRDIGHKSEIPGQNGRLIKITSRKMPPIVGVSALSEQAALLRQEGNIYFQRDRFGAAIDAYTGAITLCPDVAILWTNRALCHRKLNDWTELEEDSRRAIQRDNSSIKVPIQSHRHAGSHDPVVCFPMEQYFMWSLFASACIITEERIC